MTESLLSHLAGNFIKQYENVANTAVCYLLNKYGAAQEALARIIERDVSGLNYQAEYSIEQGRPDIVGLDESGDIQVILEGKFWAALTDNQPNEYLRKLPENGVLLFLTPERRKEALQHEIDLRVSDEAFSRHVKLISWNEFITCVENQTGVEPNFELKSDLYQLDKLCAQVDIEGMPPLEASDLDPMIGRITFQLADLLDDCRDRIKQWPETDFRNLKATGWKLGYGFYFRFNDLACQLGFSSYRWFMEKPHTPIFLNIWDADFKPKDQIRNCLLTYDKDNLCLNDRGYFYAVVLEPGMDKLKVVSHIVKITREVLDYLDSRLGTADV